MALALGLPLLVQVGLTFFVFFLALSIFRKKKDPRYPPGPPALPLVGNLLQMGSKPQDTLKKWADQYGAAFSMKMGMEDAIFMNDTKLIREVFLDNSCAARTTNAVFQKFSGGGDNQFGILMSEGADWEAQRRFALRKLRDFGFAKSSMEALIVEEVNEMIKWFEKNLDKPITNPKIFNWPVVNSLNRILCGERHPWDEGAESPKVMIYSQDIMVGFNKVTVSGLMYATFLRFIAPNQFGWTKYAEDCDNLTALVKESVHNHIAKLDENNPKDLIDHYLIEIKKHDDDPTSSFHKENGIRNAIHTIYDLFFAGSETTALTLSWTMLFLAHDQRVQRKLQKELDTVLGGNMAPSVDDRAKLPYLQATVMEALRRTVISNNGVPHRMAQDAVFQGYFFPKGTQVFANLYYACNDAKVWGDPEKFRPERFLTEDETKLSKQEAYCPFSLGKRACLGESLAKDSMFLFIAGILQKFNIKPDPSDKNAGNSFRNAEPSAKVLNEPEHFKIVVSRR